MLHFSHCVQKSVSIFSFFDITGESFSSQGHSFSFSSGSVLLSVSTSLSTVSVLLSGISMSFSVVTFEWEFFSFLTFSDGVLLLIFLIKALKDSSC